ncbi:hypothetical protein EVAR_64977_1 [Eumeta japonica]|uniref:Uncharacterized protein n=1 Tax=Eumeta variegata TaxID=151549 RepID=A0A4C1ZXZ8_EUMVA|nr:hypothetical protein EVAR_64977_1 [Eumeta japonica]
MVATGNGESGFDSGEEPEKRLPHLRKAAGATYWRASLVPAAAVTPAPIAYIKVVAVKTFVVELVLHTGSTAIIVVCTVPYVSIMRLSNNRSVMPLDVLGSRYNESINVYFLDREVRVNR